jgi:hypothetical protein
MTLSREAHASEPPGSELARLRERIDGGALGDARRELADLVERNRAGGLRLLDQLLDDDRRLDVRLPAVEALVTALWLDESRHGKRGVASPSQLTPDLANLARRIGSARPRQLADAVLQLSRAAASQVEGPLRLEVIHAIEALKASLGTNLLAANVLDAAVAYNLAMWDWEPVGEPGKQSASAAEPEPGPSVPALTSDRDSTSTLAPEPPGGAPQPSSGAPVETASARGDAGADARAWPTLDASGPLQRAAPPRDEEASHAVPRRWIAGALAAAALVCGVLQSLSGGPTLRAFPAHELRALSPLLASGYRDHGGAGPLFVGRFGAQWLALAPEHRESAAREVVARLAQQGVREVMLYDPRLRLAAGYARGTLRSFVTAAPPATDADSKGRSSTPAIPEVSQGLVRIPHAPPT